MKKTSVKNIKWTLILYDLVVAAISGCTLFYLYRGDRNLTIGMAAVHTAIIALFTILSRICYKVYSLVWRYGGIQSYIKLLIADFTALPFIAFIERCVIPYSLSKHISMPFPRYFSAFCLNVLFALSIRLFYRYAYKYGDVDNPRGKILKTVLKICSFGHVEPISKPENRKIKVAVIGAGNVGITLVDELLQNSASAYTPVCLVDTDKTKIGREILNIPILEECDATLGEMEDNGVQEVIFTIPSADADRRKKLYDYYRKAGYRIKVYDFPSVENEGSGKRHLREFDAEELLFRKPLNVVNEKTREFYRDKVVLITGGGGSIGSELCRQVAKIGPKKLVILDVYENGAYDVQQELRLSSPEVDIRVEIASVTNEKALDRAFEEYKPDAVINAAAHKHVPLMEKNCIEAVENNVFGTLNTVKASIKHGVQRMMMVSTDKAVNPTNVMGATKRMCEMIVQAYAAVSETTTFSATRFGNVLGSAGSVIPLFKKQIARGGPITLTDKRIIRYFMTIPEASQLVLTSGAMAENGELFVLDMGQPVKILDLAENMIRLSGMEPGVDIEIKETGLRPGEKLFEELLIKKENLDKTDNDLIFVERDKPISMDELEAKLEILRQAVESDDDNAVREAMKKVVPTFRSPEEVNKEAEQSREMKEAQ